MKEELVYEGWMGGEAQKFFEGRTYPATILSLNGLVVKDGKIELIYVTNEDSDYYVRKWFWTMHEWREQQLKEIGI